MRRFHIIDNDYEGYNQREDLLEKAFIEGCEHGYKKAMRETTSYNERKSYKEGFEEKLEKLKRKLE
jgi:hypothetical protein